MPNSGFYLAGNVKHAANSGNSALETTLCHDVILQHQTNQSNLKTTNP
jgi:hypothetical protein